MELLISFVFFGLCMLGMGVGVIFSDRRLRGSCGGDSNRPAGRGVSDGQGHDLSCGSCPRKESEVCPTDDPLVRLAQIGHPNPQAHH